MMIRTKGIGHGRAEGSVVLSHMPISFLGGVDASKGCVVEQGSDIMGESFAGKILSFPHGKGSTVGSYVIYQLKKSGTAPAAILNQKAEAIVATGAILSGIPMLTGIPTGILARGDKAIVNADEGTIELPFVVGKVVTTAIVRNEGKILVMKRSSKVGTYREHWAGVSGSLLPGEAPADAALREVREETGIDKGVKPQMVQTEPVYARDGGIIWKVHPFLIDVDADKVKIDWEHDEYRWILPGELENYQTVPRLGEVVRSLLKAEAVAARKVC
jgi:hypothetical protein